MVAAEASSVARKMHKCPQVAETATTAQPRTTLQSGVAETYRRFAELQAVGKLDLSDLEPA